MRGTRRDTDSPKLLTQKESEDRMRRIDKGIRNLLWGSVSTELLGSAMISVASKLRAEREKRGIALKQIASDTRISLRHLESIEEGRYGDLPGGIYNRAFLRAYCESINLDSSEIIERYEQEVSPHRDKRSRVDGQLRPGGFSLGISPIIIWSLMLLFSATGLFLSRKWIAEIFSPYFSRSSGPGDHYESLATFPPDTPAPLDFSIMGTHASPQASLVPSESPAQAVLDSNHGDAMLSSDAPLPLIRLELIATEQCWVFIDRDGSPAVNKLLKPGEIESLGAAEKLYIILGNAGGVHLKINDKPLGQLGKTGEVIRLLITEKSIPDLLDQTAG